MNPKALLSVSLLLFACEPAPTDTSGSGSSSGGLNSSSSDSSSSEGSSSSSAGDLSSSSTGAHDSSSSSSSTGAHDSSGEGGTAGDCSPVEDAYGFCSEECECGLGRQCLPSADKTAGSCSYPCPDVAECDSFEDREVVCQQGACVLPCDLVECPEGFGCFETPERPVCLAVG